MPAKRTVGQIEAFINTDLGGSPAFPWESSRYRFPGLTFREYAAVKMMAALLSNPEASRQISDECNNHPGKSKKLMARVARQHADALMAELEDKDDAN